MKKRAFFFPKQIARAGTPGRLQLVSRGQAVIGLDLGLSAHYLTDQRISTSRVVVLIDLHASPGRSLEKRTQTFPDAAAFIIRALFLPLPRRTSRAMWR